MTQPDAILRDDGPSLPLALPGQAGGDDAARLAELGHDLRSAVSDIIGGLRLIDQTDFEPGVQLQLERIRSSGEALARLIEETLAVMTHDEPDSAPANIHMARFLYDLEMRWSGRALERGLRLDVTANGEVPAVIAVDRIALERILSNTLSNAIKYTEQGQVTLTVGQRSCGTLHFSVEDTGSGFCAAALDRLFQFEGRPEGAAKPGHGLGMHISRQMADRIGGAISVVNRAEGGASVVLTIPPERWQPETPGLSSPLPDLSSVKVLLAEDTPTNQLLITQMLSGMGAEVEVAGDGVEALHWLERESFDIALIDVEMPRLSGIDVIRTLRANDRIHARMPIVAVTAYVLRANRESLYAAGADAILSKPIVSVEALGQAITSALDRHHGRSSSPRAAHDPVPVVAATFDHLMEIAGEASRGELLSRLAEDLQRAGAGLKAGLADDDRTAIRAESHVLIALAGAVGAERLQKLSEALNASAHHRSDPARATLGEETLRHVEALCDFIAARRAAYGDAA